MQFEIPIVDTEIDTDDPAESATNFGGAVVGLGLFAAAAGIATYGYSRVKSIAGVEGSTLPEGL